MGKFFQALPATRGDTTFTFLKGVGHWQVQSSGVHGCRECAALVAWCLSRQDAHLLLALLRQCKLPAFPPPCMHAPVLPALAAHMTTTQRPCMPSCCRGWLACTPRVLDNSRRGDHAIFDLVANLI